MKISFHQVPRTRKYKILKSIAIVNLTLFVINLFSFVFIAEPRLTPSQAQKETLLCLRICPSGAPSCSVGTCAVAPSVTTDSVDTVTQTSAHVTGTVSADGGDSIVARGFVLATTTNPTILNATFSLAGATGTFDTTLTGLATSTDYYVRAYASNTIGLVYGQTLAFTTLAPEEVPQTGDEAQEDADEGGAPLLPQQPTPFIPGPELFISDTQQTARVSIAGVVMGDTDEIPLASKITANKPIVGFTGNTNIRDAQVFIILGPSLISGTTVIDEQGNWEWRTPRPLAEGFYTAIVEAYSPHDSRLFARQQYAFEVVYDFPETERPLVPLPPGPGGTTIDFPTSTEPRISSDDIYIFDIDVLAPTGGLTPTTTIMVRSKITSLNPTTAQTIVLTYEIFDAQGSRLYEQVRAVGVTESRIDTVLLKTQNTLSPGTYVVTVTLKKGSVSYAATESIRIQSDAFRPAAAEIIPRTDFIEMGLLISALMLYLFLILLLYLMYREYLKAKRALQKVDEEDLYERGMIS